MRTSGPDEATAFAPATVANLGPGFDILGLAVDGVGDRVTARFAPTPGVRLVKIVGDEGRLPREAERNTAGIAARATLDRIGVDVGIELELEKGLPIGSGLGSSAASAAAAASAVNFLLGTPLRKQELIPPCIEAEAAVSGRHADNVAPAIMGGLVLVRRTDPLDFVRVPVPEGLIVVVVTPHIELSTRAARAALPRDVALGALVRIAADLAALVSACHAGDLDLLGRSLGDEVVTPARAALIPGADSVMAGARASGALGSSISGAGPSIFALCHAPSTATRVAAAMQAAFAAAGLESRSLVSPADCPGARRVWGDSR